MMTFERQADSEYVYVDPAAQWPETGSEMQNDFAKNGYVIIKNLFNQTEIDKFCKAFDNSQAFWDSCFRLSDREKKYFDQGHWTEPGTDILGLAAGNAKSCGIGEQLLNRGEVYLYSGKVIMKREQTGGAILWHQDYGYYYNSNTVFPDFVSCIIALTKSDHENGGLQIIPGSQHCGRITHTKTAGQQSADLERVDMILKHLPLVDANLAAGDCLFIHANLLHRSLANDSGHKRWNFILTYNARNNSPHTPTYNASYGQYELHRYPADSILGCDDLVIHKRQYLDPNTNPNINIKA